MFCRSSFSGSSGVGAGIGDGIGITERLLSFCLLFFLVLEVFCSLDGTSCAPELCGCFDVICGKDDNSPLIVLSFVHSAGFC